MPGTNQQVSQVFLCFFTFFLSCIKDKYQLQKLWSPPEHISRGWFLWVYHIGLWIDHRRRREKKQLFKGLGDPPGFPFLKKKTKLEQNRAELSSPADTCGSGGPRTLKCSQHP